MSDGIAKKKDPQKWAQAKARAKAKMGGKRVDKTNKGSYGVTKNRAKGM